MVFPKIVELKAAGSDVTVKLAIEEFDRFYISEGSITGVKLKDGTKAEIENINFGIDYKTIPEK